MVYVTCFTYLTLVAAFRMDAVTWGLLDRTRLAEAVRRARAERNGN